MSEEIKKILTEIQEEIKNINSKLEQLEMKASNGNYVYSDPRGSNKCNNKK